MTDAVDRRMKAWLTTIAAWALLGCSGPSETELLSSARKDFEEGRNREALIHLKGALQQNSQSGEARLLLGKTLLRLGDARGAALELSKAIDAGAPRDEAVPALARAQLRTFMFKEVVTQHSTLQLSSPTAFADLKGSIAAALLYQGDLPRAESVAKEAVGLDPKATGARLVLARLQAARGEFDGAMASAKAIVADSPASTEATQLLGELYWYAKGDFAKAVEAFEATLKTDPRHLQAHTALTVLELGRNDVPAFRKRVAEMKRLLPSAIETKVREVELAVLDKDVTKAREGVQQLLRLLPDNDRILQLAGVIELAGGSPAQALTHLQRALTRNPELPVARRLLAETQLKVGDSTKALAVLEPLLARPRPDVDTLRLAAEAHLLRGDLQGAEELYGAAAKAKPDDATVGTALALAMIARGRTDAGFERLAQLAKASDTTTADLALISVHMRRGDTDRALQAIEQLRLKRPESALPWLLRARVLSSRGDLGGARESLAQALKVEPTYFPAVQELAALETDRRNPDGAIQRYRALLSIDPKNVNGLMALAFEIKKRGGPPEEVTKLLQDAMAAGPGETGPRLALVEHHLSLPKNDEALNLAQETAARFPNDLDVIDSLGRTQLAKGDLQQAMSSFGKVAAALPRSAVAQLRLADVERRKRNLDESVARVGSALALSPDLPAAQGALLTLALRDGKSDSALKVTRDIQKRHPKASAGFALEGAIHAAKERWPQAIASFEAAVQRSPSASDLAIRLHGMYVRAGRANEAQRFASKWEADHPRDGAFHGHLGMMALLDRDLPRAEAKFRQALAQLPDDPRIMNNLAWTLLEQKKPGGRVLAEKANEILPDTPIFMDTLATALSLDNQLPEALALQRKALDRLPDNHGMRLNLAKLLLKSGDKEAARRELDKLQGLGSQFQGHAEVAALLKSLSS